MSNPFRTKIPARKCTKTYSDHTRFKRYLREDFHKSCGYCNDSDIYSGGPRTYQVDHFIPRNFAEALATTYSNLVYSCPYCNRAKWNKWPSQSLDEHVINDEGFIDPCLEEYDSHIERDQNGVIVPTTPLGKYMHSHLHLHLERHAIIWKLTQIDDEIEKINSYKENGKLSSANQNLINLLNTAFTEFRKKLENTYD